jgi:hypothetical protein
MVLPHRIFTKKLIMSVSGKLFQNKEQYQYIIFYTVLFYHKNAETLILRKALQYYIEI